MEIHSRRPRSLLGFGQWKSDGRVGLDDRDQTVAASTNTWVKGLAGTTAWNGTFTYAFATAAQETYVQDNWIYGKSVTGTYNPLGTTGQELAYRQDFLDAVAALSRVCGVDIKAASSGSSADFLIMGYDDLKSSSGALHGISTAVGADAKPGGGYQAFMALETGATSQMWTLNSELGGQGFRGPTVLHEFAHALGLAHPHDTGQVSTAWALKGFTGDHQLDNERYTIMSYEGGGFDQDTPRSYGHAFTPMALDVAALQHL